MVQRLRRLLWLVPTLLTTTILAFATLSILAAQRAADDDLPLFFNARPEGVQAYTHATIVRLSESTPGTTDSDRAAKSLLRLGAAAFPILAAELDSLPLAGRLRVARALVPVAQRMGVVRGESLDDPEEALAFWYRYWRDHSLDFRRSAVRRAVKRLAKSPSGLRRREVQQLDTFALAELIDELASTESLEDPARLQRLGDVLAHTTEQPWKLEPTVSLEERRAYVARWQSWWSTNRRFYEKYAGPRRIAAMFTQTSYFQWLSGLLQPLGSGFFADTMSRRFLSNARGSLLLLLASAVGGYVGIVATRYFRLVAGAPHRDRVWRRRLAGLWNTIIVPIPLALVLYVIKETGSASLGAAALILTCATALRWSGSAVFQRLPELGLYLGDSPERAARRRAVRTVYFTAQIGRDLPILFSHVCLTEYTLGLSGLGAETVRAAISHDTAWLMVMVIVTTAVMGLCNVLGGTQQLRFRADVP